MEKTELVNPELLSKADIEELLPYFKDLKEWIKKVEDMALANALKGIRYKGFKLVEGRSISRYINENALIKRLEEIGYKNTSVFYKPKELVSVSDLKKIIKKDFEKVSDLVEKPQGKPTLVEESDKRQEMTLEKDVEDELFNDMDIFKE